MSKSYILTALCPLEVSAYVYVGGYHELKNHQGLTMRIPAQKTELQRRSLDTGETLESTLIDELTPDDAPTIFAVEHPQTVGEVKIRHGVYKLEKIAE
jgi:hypothetical protein